MNTATQCIIITSREAKQKKREREKERKNGKTTNMLRFFGGLNLKLNGFDFVISAHKKIYTHIYIIVDHLIIIHIWTKFLGFIFVSTQCRSINKTNLDYGTLENWNSYYPFDVKYFLSFSKDTMIAIMKWMRMNLKEFKKCNW